MPFVYGAWVFFFLQFTVGYHCIYNVEYLGWDLVEPVTYSVAQGMFVGGIIYMKRKQTLQSTEFSDLQQWFSTNKLDRMI